MKRLALALIVSIPTTSAALSAEPRELIRLAENPALSPDGSTLVFSHSGDIWTVPATGGRAHALTRHPARDLEPEFSPDGRQIAFTSDRDGSYFVYVIPAEGGTPRQVGFHSSGYTLEGWAPDGRSLLVQSERDHYWRESARFFLIDTVQGKAETLLFDAACDNGSLSPDGKRILFNREGVRWWRKGYRGSEDSQVWMFDRETRDFRKILDPPGGARWPLWRSDGKGLYYVGLHKGAWNLREHDIDTGADRPLTAFEEDSVVYPCISRDGSTIVFRNLFDLYRIRPSSSEPPRKIEIWSEGDDRPEPIERRAQRTASQVAFTRDGLEIAFIAGGDLWVMDTELREPIQVTTTPEEERDPTFSPSGDAIVFVSDQGGQPDLWKAERQDSTKEWWRNTSFKLDRLSQDADVESDLKWSPEGSGLAFLKGAGDLWVMNVDGKQTRRVIASWNPPRYDWSPDGKWLVYARADNDFNEDIWLSPLDGSRPPFNLSRHPDNESDPVWSPDGKLIAFTGRRMDNEVDIYFVWLREEDDEKSTRERTLEKALEKMKQARTKGSKTSRDTSTPAPKGSAPPGTVVDAPEDAKKTAPDVGIDFDGIHERIRRVSIPASTETGLFWSPDSKKLAFSGAVDGKRGVYTIEFPEDLKPKLLSAQVGLQARWLATGNQVVWLAAGVPANLIPGGKETAYRFRALQAENRPEKYRAAFDIAWRTMRDKFYDERLNNRDWNAIRRKYSDAAAAAPDNETLAVVVNLMLGELNGSHLGYTPAEGGAAPRRGPIRSGVNASEESRWNLATAHFGLRFDADSPGPGLKVRDVLPESPADHKATRIEPGEIVLAIDDTPVDSSMDLTKVLNGPAERDVRLKIRAKDGIERTVTLRPISFSAARDLLYDKWVKDNRKTVEESSRGTLGYLHIQGMNFPSFYKFEQELYSAGSGKAGLVIDVRENGGGSTTDHLLTALTQPSHAITVPRGGGAGYPQDRRVYATWSKPIVVLCNQNSFSNAEIFSHAIKTLKRGKLVGVTTAGGVLSTGSTAIMDVGFLRLPNRGWFLIETGRDMELNGAVPDYIVWPHPADFARGYDAQLSKAVEVLLADVATDSKRPRPNLQKASER